MITITDAAEQHLHTLISQAPSLGLRLSVHKGGCAGLEYEMEIAEAKGNDHTITQNGIKVHIDHESASYFEGCTLDYVDDLAGGGFRIKNPNATRSCGCGTSFEPASQEPTPAPAQQKPPSKA